MGNARNVQRQVSLRFAPGTLWAEVAALAAKRARAYRDDLVRAGRFPAQHDRFVGGRPEAPEESLRPGEVIVYRARSLGLAAAAALEELRARSPGRVAPQSRGHNTRTRYRDSFFVALRGAGGWGGAVAAEGFNPARVPPDAEEAAVFSNMPFSRKVDVQMVGKQPLRFTTPPGMFGDVAALLRRRYPTLDCWRIYNVPRAIRFPLGTPAEGGKRLIQYPGVMIGRRK